MTNFFNLSIRVVGTVLEQQLFKPGDTLIVGLSGGADSTALLDLLANLPGMPLHLIAAHLNHCLRGAESDSDEIFCRQLSEKYRIPFESRRVDVKTLADKNSLNLEDAGRLTRIAFFDELLNARKAQAVVLAHHADDQAETVLMRLLRGSGMTGLAGISYRNDRGYVRPLLGITRSEIETYLIERNLVWREDSSNRDITFLRNRIRHELLPLLEQYNPSVRKQLATTATILSAENDLLDKLARQAASEICKTSQYGITCCIKSLKSQSPALQRRLIRLTLSRLCGNLEQFSHHHIEAISRMIVSTRSNSTINLPQNIVTIKEYDALVFKTKEEAPSEKFKMHVCEPGVYKLPDNALLLVEHSPLPAHFNADNSNTAYFDLDKVPFPWHIRTFHPGDRIQQIGMTGRKKLKDLFIDNKIPPSQRSRIPIVLCNKQPIWVCGLRISRLACLDDRSSRIIKVVFTRGE